MNIAKKATLTVTAANASAGAAVTVRSPGVASGLTGQVPVDVPLQADGLTANLVGALNPAFGNTSVSR
ncbi:chaplin [Streptomyces sp. NRRL WC-3725]|uniref:chaplin n=1 Tax=Streptomyces sp. NRRL WC-3725 TaxID=1463933 RepID=UPI0004CC14DA|nr:chaplin [Streptomyces sp. NRRL WC-3725]